MADFPLTGLRSVDLDVADPLAAARFYEDVWGLQVVEACEALVRLRGTGRDQHIVALHKADRVAIRSFTLRAAVDTDLAVMARRVTANRGREVSPVTASDDAVGGRRSNLIAGLPDAECSFAALS
jgi:hypothetical protein